MFKAIFYKEWIKTRWYFLISMLVTLCFTAFQLLRVSRAMTLHDGPAFFWEVMIMKGNILIDSLQFIPIGVGIIWALVQYVPEVNNKCLKLSLHLPYSQLKITFSMLASGFALLMVCYLLNFTMLYIFFNSYFAPELVRYVLVTALPWFMAGVAGYLLFTWICLEPTWKMRVFNLVVSAFVLKIYFISTVPGSYAPFLGILAVGTLLLFALSWLSVVRFKEGKQD